MSGGYYSIDSILTDAQKVPCTFTLTVPQLGHLTSDPNHPLEAGTQVSLPIWLATLLALSQSLSTSGALVTLDLPTALSPRVMNALKADPRTVDLRALAPHFFGLGTRMLELFEEEEWVGVLSESFKTRAAVIADQAHNPRGALGEGAEFMRGLDENERQLFRVAHDSAKAVRSWIADMKKT